MVNHEGEPLTLRVFNIRKRTMIYLQFIVKGEQSGSPLTSSLS
jgi:hypothetical protein